jgi:hypothetical protein
MSASNIYISLNIIFYQTEYINQLLSVLSLGGLSTSLHLIRKFNLLLSLLVVLYIFQKEVKAHPVL